MCILPAEAGCQHFLCVPTQSPTTLPTLLTAHSLLFPLAVQLLFISLLAQFLVPHLLLVGETKGFLLGFALNLVLLSSPSRHPDGVEGFIGHPSSENQHLTPSCTLVTADLPSSPLKILVFLSCLF